MQFFPFLNADATSSGLESLFQGGGASPRDDGRHERFAALLDGELAAVRDAVPGRQQAVRSMWDKARSGAQALASGRLLPGGPDFGSGATGATGARGQRSRAVESLAALVSGAGPVSGVRELSGLRMTREDFLGLRDGLKAYGLSSDDLRALDERISSQAGLTWGQFLGALSQKMVELGREFPGLALSDAQSRDMLTLFQKLGFTSARAGELLSTLENGGTATVWEAIGAKLAAMPEGATVELTGSELATLGKVMRLSDGGQGRLAALLGGADSARLNSGQLSTVMTMLRAEVAADKQVDADANQALRNLVNQGLTAAADRAGLAAQAGNRADNDARNRRVLAQESRRRRAEQADGSATDASGDEGVAARILAADPNVARARAAQGEPQGDAAREGRAGQDGREGRYLADGALRRGASAQGEGSGGKGDAKAGGDAAEAAWGRMWDKVRTDDAPRTFAQDTALAAARLADAHAAIQTGGREALAGMDRELAARALRQVESGLLRTLNQNQKQLVLRLDPPELGKLSMVLTAKDGEVSATFRAETREARALLSEQMAQLRSQLEQQGIRVGRMEVQTQLSGEQNSGQWLFAGDHNQAREREESARRQGLLRQLRGQDGDMAQEMQNEPHTARIARQGLDIIA